MTKQLPSRFAASVLALMVFSSAAHAVEVQPVIDATLLGGQYYYNGADNSFDAIADLTAAPYIKFNDAWAVEPLYHGEYNGTQQVQDLIGGGTLFQDSQDHTGSLKIIRSFDNGLKIKAVGSYSADFLRETADETWGDGLYDNRRVSGGTEAEWSWASDHFIRAAYDYYAINFPNYNSLESQGAAIGLGREFNAPNVLNTNNNALTIGTQTGLPGRGLLELNAGYTWTSFNSQHLVNEAGELVSDLRNDEDEVVSLQGTWPVWMKPGGRVYTSLGYTWDHLYSNQNNYDAAEVFFNPNYFANLMQTLQNQWTLAVGDDPWTLETHWSLSHQQYAGRLTQDAAGTYGTDLTHVNSAGVGVSFTYPIARGFHVTARFDAGWNNSNNENQSVYQYHYNTQDYLLGFTYAY